MFRNLFGRLGHSELGGLLWAWGAALGLGSYWGAALGTGSGSGGHQVMGSAVRCFSMNGDGRSIGGSGSDYSKEGGGLGEGGFQILLGSRLADLFLGVFFRCDFDVKAVGKKVVPKCQMDAILERYSGLGGLLGGYSGNGLGRPPD